MRQLPDWAHAYFPSSFDCKAPHKDRETVVELAYEPAYDDVEWRESLPPETDGIYKYWQESRPWDDDADQIGIVWF